MDTYFRYSPDGDHVVGRFAAGLPTDDPKFAYLPPYFRTETDADRATVRNAVNLMFNGYPENRLAVWEFCLASLVQHFVKLDAWIPATHKLRQTPLWTDSDLYQRLKPLVVLEIASEDSRIRATGVPLHIKTFARVSQAVDLLMELPAQLNTMANTITRETVAQTEQVS